MLRTSLAPLFAAAALAPMLPSASPGQDAVDFDRDVQPILTARCVSCHGSKLHLGELRLDRRSDAVRGGGSGVPAIVPGKSSESLLLRYVSGLDPKMVMPPSGPRLTPEQIRVLRSWIDQGAQWPGQDEPQKAKKDEAKHWAFEPRLRVSPPAVRNRAWVRNPIDQFVLAKLEARGWQPSPAAEPFQLLRRVHLDLTGLPPTIEEQAEFSGHANAKGLDQMIDRVLARPTFGERWARHWLDVVRFAETNGYERDAAKPHAWRYRDYVIKAFNDDKPYDRFILEQIAGDELPDVNAETLIATGFNRLGPWDDEPADPETDRFDQLDDLVSTTSQAFLGLTLGCARCHNHKFDPVTARDYYGMVAIFNGLERPRNGRTELDLPVGTQSELEREAERNRKIAPLRKNIEDLRESFRRTFITSGESRLPADALQAFRTEPAKRSDEQKALTGRYTKELETEVAAALPATIKASIAELEAQIAGLKRDTPDLPRGYFLHEPKAPATTHVLIRGNARALGPEVSPAVPAVLTSAQPEFPPAATTSLRRLTLARWLAHPDNPLTARVIVNRVWQAHFGEGLVRTASDFGRIGEKPTHPELLDWLASWFVENGWSLKKLHRLILTSNTWRMSKRVIPKYLAEDPENRLLWRVPYTRIEVEAIRDSMLAVSGKLNPRMYGPSMYPFVPKQALEGSSDPDKIWQPFVEDEASRRTVYAFIKRSMIVPMLEVLDFCDTSRSSAKRINTNVAPQALTLFNGDFVNRQARHLAARLEIEAGPDPERQIQHAFRLAFARKPTTAEAASMLRFVREEGGTRNALEQLCRVILNMNEFVYPD
ncbi:MAG TPA: PSD1 and planctomycete cytochrome C domain-containing protein [Bryobacteraceae bacterium]|nr:PSD1 and planctomycete cytochrome C domain-containing protein [Bryobacteraceae bacterium]